MTMSPWQILDVGSIWMKEFASALAEEESVVAWQPSIENAGAFQRWERTRQLDTPPLEINEFPLQRGYSRAPLRWLLPYEDRLLKRLLSRSPDPENSPLICTTPFYVPVAERWPGPVVYYVTDLTFAYEGLQPAQVRSLDIRMCRVARAICPNSRRIAHYLTHEALCDVNRITVIPNATRAENIAAEPQYAPGPLPDDIADLPRPIIGVLGDLSGNMDWKLIVETIRRTQSFSWVFVGPTSRKIPDESQSQAREWVKSRARFVGMKPYGELQRYARAVDAAVLPYRRKEPTFSGSSTRFYEHLAAGRPMVGTRGFAELTEKEPLLVLVNTANEMAEALQNLESTGFHDGHEIERWEASKVGTWQQRARTLRDALRIGATASPLHQQRSSFASL